MDLTGIKKYFHSIYDIIQKMILEDDTDRRMDLLRLYCFLIIILTTLMLVLNILQKEYLFVIALSIFAGMALLILYLVRFKQKAQFLGNVLLILSNILAVYLIYNGGVDGNGHLWVLFLPTLTMFVYGFRFGLISLILMIAIFTVMFIYPDNQLLKYAYPLNFKLRFIIAFSGLTFFSAAAEISRAKANLKLKEKNKVLQKLLSEVKELSGLLPICSHCKKIRDDKGYWNEVEEYLLDHSKADFSHSLCPGCAQKLYPEYYQDKNHDSNDRKSENSSEG